MAAQSVPATPHAEWVCPGGGWGGDGPQPACGGNEAAPAAGTTPAMTQGYSALGTAIGNAIGCALFHGPGCPQRPTKQQVQADIAAANAREAAALEEQREAEAAHDAAMAAAAAERARQAHAQFLAERDQLAAMMRGAPPTAGLRGDVNTSGTLRGVEPSANEPREDVTPAVASGSAPPPIWGPEPPLPSSVGNALTSNIAPSVDPTHASDYIGRALDFMHQNIEQTAQNALDKSALSGELFAETEMGPYGMATVVMVNVAQLPNWEFGKITGAVTGNLSEADAAGLTTQAANRIFDFQSPVNQAVQNGVLETARDEASASVEASVKKNLASLAAEFLPVRDEVRGEFVQQSLTISGTATAAYKRIFMPPDSGQ